MKRETALEVRKQFYTSIGDDLVILKNVEQQEYEKWERTWSIENGKIDFKRCEDIISVYNTLSSTEEKEALIDLLGFQIKDTNLDRWFKIVCFISLYQLGYGDEALECLENSGSLPVSIIYPIKDLLESDITFFNSDDLKVLLRVFRWINDRERNWENIAATHNTIELINNLRYKNLLHRLNVTVTEINNDRKRVSEYLKEFWFEEKYNKTLTLLDKFMGNEGDEDLIPGWAIWTLREFFKSFYIDLAKKIAQINSLNEVPKNTKSTEEIGHAVNYIWKEFGLSWDEEKLLKWYTEIVNNSWSHSMLSEKKYLRLTRNIGIEIWLFMLSKLKDYSLK